MPDCILHCCVIAISDCLALVELHRLAPRLDRPPQFGYLRLANLLNKIGIATLLDAILGQLLNPT